MFSLARAVFPVLATLTALNAQTLTYSFQVVAQTGTSIDGNTITNFTQPALLDDSGDVVFAAATSAGQGLFTTDRAIVKTGDTIAGKQLTFITSPSLNQAGEVAFLGGFSGGSGIFTPSRLLVQTGDAIDGATIFNFYSGISYNAGGSVAFEAATGTGYPTGTADFLTSSQGSSLLISTGQSVQDKTLSGIGTPVLNDDGRVGFRGEFLNNANPNDTGVITIDTAGDSTPDLLAESGKCVGHKKIQVFGYPAKILSDGSAVTTASFNGGSGIFKIAPKGSGASVAIAKSGDVIGGLTLTQIGLVAVNSNADTAFFARFAGGQGIFTPDGVIVKMGDQIGLNTVTAILLNSTAYNSSGAVAFTVQLDDGSKAIVLGTPNSL